MKKNLTRIALFSAMLAGTASYTHAQVCNSPVDNKISNYSFESLDGTGRLRSWTVVNGSFTRSTGYEICGNYYGLLYSERTGLSRIYQDVEIPGNSIKLTLKLWAGIHANANQQVGFTFLDDAGNEMTTGRTFTSVTKIVPGLELKTLSADVPANARKVRVEGRLSRNQYTPGYHLKLDMVTLVFEEAPLPVKLSSFQALAQETHVKIRWQTTAESNSSSFQINRSEDGTRWEKLGEVSAKGEYDGVSDYQFTDINPRSGINYYRLKMTDQDGTFTYSPIVSVKGLRGEKFNELNFYPNPSRGLVNLRNQRELRSVQVFDLTGREVYNSTRIGSEGQIDLTSLSSGVYVMKWLDEGGERLTKRLILQKDI